MASAFWTLVTATCVLLIFYLTRTYTYWKRRGIPTVNGIVPFLGHMLPVLLTRMNYSELNRKIHHDYPDRSMVGYYKLTSPVLLIRDPQLAKFVLQSNFSNFHETGGKIDPSKDTLLSHNSFFSTGETWKNSRRRLLISFSNVKLKLLLEPIAGVCKKLEAYLERRLRGCDSHELELKRLFSRYTGEVVASTGFSVEGWCFEDEPRPCTFDALGQRFFKTDFATVMQNTIVFAPRLNNVLRIQLVPDDVDRLFKDTIARILKCRQAKDAHRHDVLQAMLDYGSMRDERVDERVLEADAFSFFIDTYETSSRALSFVGYQLAANPRVQERLRQEVRSTIAEHGDTLTFEALKEMTYMDRVIAESQRCYPVVGFLTRMCSREIELRGSDGLVCHLEPGVEVIVSNHGLQLDPKYWPEPELFDPERFNEERKHSIEKMAMLPFGQGPRMCVGAKLAMFQMKCCLATLLDKYRLELSERTQLPIKLTGLNFLTEPVGGLWVRISKVS